MSYKFYLKIKIYYYISQLLLLKILLLIIICNSIKLIIKNVDQNFEIANSRKE